MFRSYESGVFSLISVRPATTVHVRMEVRPATTVQGWVEVRPAITIQVWVDVQPAIKVQVWIDVAFATYESQPLQPNIMQLTLASAVSLLTEKDWRALPLELVLGKT